MIPRILVIPDCQVKPGVPLKHLRWLNSYIRRKQPEVIVCIGDFADMPSLSSYDKGKKSFEGRRYKRDIQSAIDAMAILTDGWLYEYKPRMVMLLGNHEDRINRAVDDDPKLEGVIGVSDLQYEKFGWEVYPFLDVVTIGGVAFSHYFQSGDMGRPVTSARAMVQKKHMSCVMGHRQTADIAFSTSARGRHITGIHTGAFYLHNESYLRAQGNAHWRGAWMLHEVNNGSFGHTMISMDYLRRKYGQV